jgi:hypothetical protein
MKLTDIHSREEVIVDRRIANRRIRKEPRPDAAGVEREPRTGDRRQKVERRRQIDPTTCERDYSDDEITFMRGMDEYKRKSGRQFPTWSEVLEVLHSLGYRKVEAATEIYPAGRAQE